MANPLPIALEFKAEISSAWILFCKSDPMLMDIR